MNRLLYIALTLLILFGQASAQGEQVWRQPYVDLRRYYLGFRVGTHLQDMRINNVGLVDEQGVPLFASTPSYGTGMSVGLVGGYVLVPNLELRFIPTLHFGEQRITYSDGYRERDQIRLRTNFLHLPLQLKYAALRLNNIRPFVALGAYGAVALGGQRGAILRTKAWDYGLTLSVGCDFYLRKVKICPELSWGYGLGDAIRHSRPDLLEEQQLKYTNALGKSKARMILFTLNFE